MPLTAKEVRAKARISYAETLWHIANGETLREIADRQRVTQCRVNQKGLMGLRRLCPALYQHIIDTGQTTYPGWCAIIRQNAMQVKRACQKARP
jgi:hypothetical protein